VYACTAPAPDKRHYQSVLQGGKLREADISVLLGIRRHLEAHYLSDCTLTGISRTFGINTFKLKYGFKALFGVSVIQFVLDLRLEHAHQLVLHSGMPLAEVSDIAGYQQPGNFSKAFHKKYGSSPADLRKRAGLATHTG
jgi:AraC-like DNA-binding protein